MDKPELPQISEELPDGTEVQHKVHGYKGRIAGKTKLKHLFEDPNNTEEYRIRISGDRIEIASAANLICLKALKTPDRSEEITARHKNFLSEQGITYQGTRKAKNKFHRIANCWKCAALLDNKLDVECITCGWILCNCGACGCGYNKDIKDKNRNY